MKILFISIILLLSINVKAQLTFIGNDDLQNNYDGYSSGKQIQGLVKLNEIYYFLTPNGKFYKTDGTEDGTQSEKNFSPQTTPYLFSTKKYVYFGYGNGYIKDLARYSPTTGINIIRNPLDNNAMFYLNAQVVPGNNFLVDEAFINYENEALLIKKFTNNNFYIYIINDKNDNPKVDLVFTQKLDNNYITTPISVNTELETFKTDVYCNGRERPTGVYQTTININERLENDDTKYRFKTNFSLLKKGLYPYERFLRTKDNIYTLFKIVDSATSKKTYSLFYYKNKSIFPTKNELSLPNDDIDTQILDGDIYISCKGYLIKYNEAKDTYEVVIFEKNALNPWQNISKNTRFLKVGNYYMYRRNNELAVYNTITKITTPIKGTFWHPNENYFTQYKIEAYAGKNSFYFTQSINAKVTFMRYNPVANTTTPIEFPEFKKEKFANIKAILTGENKFVFLTNYKGKKDKPVYKMFMYNEDGEAAIENRQFITTIQPKIQTAPQIEEFDATKFDTKLFTTEISKVLKDQSNKFIDIKGPSVPHEFKNRYATILPITNFAESFISDFSGESNLWRYQAESFRIKGKTEALKFFNQLDSEINKLVAGNSIKRIVDLDFKTRKIINYKFSAADESNIINVDLSTNASVENYEDAYYTITIRADKRTK